MFSTSAGPPGPLRVRLRLALRLGAPLARLEAKVALQALLRLAPEFRLRGIDLAPSFFVRGPERGFLDVTVLA